MSTTIGEIESEGMFNNSIETYVGVNHVVLFVQNGLDRDGKGTKILLNKEKWLDLIQNLRLAGQEKGWSED